ncbi:MAG: nucleotidyltransferase, partial [bacterium]
YYKEGILNNVNQAMIKKSDFKIVVDYAYGSASQIFPSILGELGIEVIAINAHIDETKITKTKVIYEKSLAQLSRIVKSLEADLGIMLDAGAEKIFICDEKGKLLQGDIELAAMVILNARANKKAQIAVPIKASRVIDELGKKYGVKIIRTKTSVRDMMETSKLPGITMVGESQGGFMYPGFQSSFDAMFAAVKLLELLAINKVKLSAIEAEVPKIRMAARNISCPPEKKGEVLRLMINGLRGKKYDLTDGIKIFDKDDWVLILPDPARPIIHFLAEAGTEAKAQKLVDQYIEKVDSIL